MEALAALSGVGFVAQTAYYAGLYRSLYTHPTQGLSTELPPLSVIIVCKDQTESLQAHLNAVLSQDYPEFEVIVVHDHAATEADDLLKRLEAEHRNLYHTFIPQSARYISHKKLGIAMGIKAAHHDIFVFTEPDSYPLSDQWLRRIAAHFMPTTDIVLGYSNYEAEGSHTVALYDRLLQQMRSLGMANEGHPYTASGRNMAYRRRLYQAQHGFTAHLALQRGEDDLFINQAATGRNTRVMTDAESQVLIAAPTYRVWREEKISYMATGRFFRGLPHLVASAETPLRLLFLVTNTALLAVAVGQLCGQGISMDGVVWTALPVVLWLVRWLLQGHVMHRVARVFGCPAYFFLLPVLDWLHPLWNFQFKLRQMFMRKEDFLRK
jgi:glycosyltransferase involved in cell wall biosynthesis